MDTFVRSEDARILTSTHTHAEGCWIEDHHQKYRAVFK
jgi:hypothetical protein